MGDFDVGAFQGRAVPQAVEAVHGLEQVLLVHPLGAVVLPGDDAAVAQFKGGAPVLHVVLAGFRPAGNAEALGTVPETVLVIGKAGGHGVAQDHILALLMIDGLTDGRVHGMVPVDVHDVCGEQAGAVDGFDDLVEPLLPDPIRRFEPVGIPKGVFFPHDLHGLDLLPGRNMVDVLSSGSVDFSGLIGDDAELVRPHVGPDSLGFQVAVGFQDVVGVELSRVFASAFFADAHDPPFVVADVDGFGVEYVDDFVVQIAHQLVKPGVGRTRGAGKGLVAALPELRVGDQKILAVGQGGDFRDDLDKTLRAVGGELPQLLLGVHPAAGVVGVDGVFGPVIHLADEVPLFRRLQNRGGVPEPAFVYLRMLFEFHGPANLQEQGVVAQVDQLVDELAEVIQVLFGRQKYPEGTMGAGRIAPPKAFGHLLAGIFVRDGAGGVELCTVGVRVDGHAGSVRRNEEAFFVFGIRLFQSVFDELLCGVIEGFEGDNGISAGQRGDCFFGNAVCADGPAG